MSEATIDLQGAWVHEIAWTGGDLCVRLSRRLGDKLGLYEWRVSGPVALRETAVRVLKLENMEDDSVVFRLVGKVASRFVERDGHGILTFEDGTQLDNPPSPHGEAWQFQGPGELLLVAPIQ